MVTPSAHHPLLVDAQGAVAYRGDVTLRLRTGIEVVGYAFNLALESPVEHSKIELLVDGSEAPVSVTLQEIAGIAQSGKDTAAGKSWSHWIERYAAKKLAAESACMQSEASD